MSIYRLSVSASPETISSLLMESNFADFLYEDIINIDSDRKVITLVFEKYFMRVEGRAGITIIIENTKQNTEVRIITAGVGRGIFFNFDWGASDSLISDVRGCMSDYILEEGEIE